MAAGLQVCAQTCERLQRSWNVLKDRHAEDRVVPHLVQRIVGARIDRQRPDRGISAEFPPHVVEQHVLDIRAGHGEGPITIEPRQTAGDGR